MRIKWPLIIFALLMFLPSAVRADDTLTKIPEFNPVCWRMMDCYNARSAVINLTSYSSLSDSKKQDEVKLGFITGSDAAPCVGGDDPANVWGRCLPAGVTKTEISFGGKNQFINIGDFLTTIYTYALGVATILAAIMIIIAGVQWTVSGGNAETITSAKHRISGSIIGLFIAYTSYFILQTINPNLVNLKLPNVWLVRAQNAVPSFCYQSNLRYYQSIILRYYFYKRCMHKNYRATNPVLN